jgi:hypothetical protein
LTLDLPVITAGLLIVVVLVLAIRFLFFRRRPVRIDTRYRDFWGRGHRRIHYNDTGKVVNQTRAYNWRGRFVKKTYVEKRCFRCGARVTTVKNGIYRCKCGNRFK